MKFRFGRNEIFSIWCGQSLLTVYMKYPEMKYGHFDRSKISFRVINVM